MQSTQFFSQMEGELDQNDIDWLSHVMTSDVSDNDDLIKDELVSYEEDEGDSTAGHAPTFKLRDKNEILDKFAGGPREQRRKESRSNSNKRRRSFTCFVGGYQDVLWS